jgi:aryl-alcohol dehydrogenase-like predicted oxidoreductase
MRFRPFGVNGTAVSAISLALTDSARRLSVAEWTKTVYSALENGVNTFEIVGRDPALLDGAGHGLKAVDRHLLFIALRLGSTGERKYDFSPETLARTVEAVLARGGFEYLDAVLLDDPADDALPPESLATLKALRSAGRTRLIGVCGQNPAVDAYISTRQFDVLSIPYNLTSGWTTRNRIRAALDHEMTVVGYDFFPEEMRGLVQSAGPSILQRRPLIAPKRTAANPLAGSGTYAFLNETQGWSPEEICLAYALTQPALATIQITTDQAPRLEELAAVTEREMPPGLSSRIEMARFGNIAPQAAKA